MSLLDDPKFLKKIEKYDKIINEYNYLLKKNINDKNIIYFCDEFRPRNNLERLLKGLFIQNKIIIHQLNLNN
jgi:hypothetical protein